MRYSSNDDRFLSKQTLARLTALIKLMSGLAQTGARHEGVFILPVLISNQREPSKSIGPFEEQAINASYARLLTRMAGIGPP